MDQIVAMNVTFRCPPELEGILPRPVPAVLGLPEWFKALPQRAYNTTWGEETLTVKKCPPFIDAMTYGFLMPLLCDLKVEDGEFSWEFDVPGATTTEYTRAPVDFHDPGQVAGSPFYKDDLFIIKFNNLWTIETPPGYSLLFTHPINRPELPFTTITGLVDCDRYTDSLINFPARWHDASFNGVLPKGTPVAQCLPVKRETWAARFAPLSREEIKRGDALRAKIEHQQDVYRHRFRAPKR